MHGPMNIKKSEISYTQNSNKRYIIYLHSLSFLVMDIRMESTPCNSCHCYLQYTHKSDKGMAELTWQPSLQTQLQIFSQHFSYLTQVSLQ